MTTRATHLRHLAHTSWGGDGWLADGRLAQYDAEPLTFEQRRAVWRILFTMGKEAENDPERREENARSAAVGLLRWIASLKPERMTETEQRVLLRDIIGRAQSANNLGGAERS